MRNVIDERYLRVLKSSQWQSQNKKSKHDADASERKPQTNTDQTAEHKPEATQLSTSFLPAVDAMSYGVIERIPVINSSKV